MSELAIFGGKPVFEKKIGYGHQYIDEADIQAVVEVLKSDFLTCGPKIEEAEQKLSNYRRKIRGADQQWNSSIACGLLCRWDSGR